MGRRLRRPGRHFPTRIPEGRPVNAGIVFPLHGHGRLNTSLGPATKAFFFHPGFRRGALCLDGSLQSQGCGLQRGSVGPRVEYAGRRKQVVHVSGPNASLESGVLCGLIRPHWPQATELQCPHGRFHCPPQGRGASALGHRLPTPLTILLSPLLLLSSSGLRSQCRSAWV